jgi:hypothetical protein
MFTTYPANQQTYTHPSTGLDIIMTPGWVLIHNRWEPSGVVNVALDLVGVKQPCSMRRASQDKHA